MNDEEMFEQAKKNMTDARQKRGWDASKPLGGNGNTGSDNVICGYVGQDGIQKTSTYPCHAPIKNYKYTKVLWSAFGYRTTLEVAEFYHDWLVNSSPWALRGAVPPNLTQQFMFEQGFIFTNLDKTPANLLHNFLIATRMAAEWPNLITEWYDLVTKPGVSFEYAYSIISLFVPSGVGTSAERSVLTGADIILTEMDKYDWPLDLGRATEEYVTNFCSAKTPGLDTKMYYPEAKTTPCNTLWGELLTKEHDPKLYSQVLYKLYDHLTETKMADHPSPIAWGARIKKETKVFSKENCLQIIELEQQRLGLKEIRKAA